MDLTDVCRVLHPATVQHTFFSAAHEPLSKVDYILGHKASINKYKKTKVTPCILTDHNGVKLELNHKRAENNQTPGD
jgi:endonuclease/exonuclease/phosphatase family metal-dependent hydrolase